MANMTTAPLSVHYDLEVSVTANGDTLPDVDVTVNGVTRQRSFPGATNHSVYYLTAIDCLADAISKQASSVSIALGNTTATRQLNGLEDVKASHLVALHQAVQGIAAVLPNKTKFV